ncbi:MAG: DUF5916 domain-containing protein [Balneolaceae bacterium]
MSRLISARYYFFSIVALLSILPFKSILAQISLNVSNPTENEVTAVFTEKAPDIDGNLDDEIWQNIKPVTQFIQTWPQDGEPATESSEARIAYDEDNLYFAFNFFDKNPELIRAKNLERGGRNSRDDHAYIGLDTFQDGRNAYLFEMNALGTQDDATITDEQLNYESFSWDAVFTSETVINEDGWTLEVSIPFRQLRFPKGDDLEFGIMMSRMINRKNERAIWPAIGMEYGGSTGALAAVSQYGTLKGLKDINRGKNIEIKPYVVAGVQNVRPDLSFESTEVDYSHDIGFDVKYGITSNLTLDLTVNTDFAQVEADNVQLDLTRFNLFFPEKREFFLERSGLFEHGNAGSTQTFFSRQIGLTDQILAGARMTGQIGRFSVGMLNIETGDKMNQLFGSQSANNSVARIRTDIFPRATIGGIFTNMEEAGHFNRALGVDTKYRFWSSSQFNAWYTNVWDSNPDLEDDAGHINLSLNNDLYGAQFSYTSIGENYLPALGFVRRHNMRQYSSGLNYKPELRIEALPFIRRLNLISSFDYIEDLNGELETTNFLSTALVEFSQRDFVGFDYQRQFERLFLPFAIRGDAVIPAGDYTFDQFTLKGETDDSRRSFYAAQITTGEFFNGNRTDFGVRMGFRQSQHLTLEGTVNHSIINLPIDNGEFDATTLSLSILGAFSRKLFTKTLIQYDNFSRDLQANIRLDWIHTPGSDLFLVYNTSYHFASADDDLFDPRRNVLMNDQIAIVKLTYLILL